MWFKITKRGQLGILPRSMLWIKSHGRNGRTGGRLGKGGVEDKGVVEGTKIRLSAFVVGEIISSMIVWNGKISKKSIIKINIKGTEMPSLAASSHREC